jgi:hypothetical protein
VIAGPTKTNSTAITKLLGKPEAVTAVVVAPDDGHEDAPNMLSCIEMTSNKLEKLLLLVG